MSEHTIECRHGQTGECMACSSERSDELAMLRTEIAAMCRGLDAERVRMRRVADINRNLTNAKYALTAELVRRDREYEAMQDEMRDLDIELTRARAERDAARAEVATLAEELLDLRGSFPVPNEKRLMVAKAIVAALAQEGGR